MGDMVQEGQEHLQEIPHRKSSKPGNDMTECVFCKVNFGSRTQRKDQKSDRDSTLGRRQMLGFELRKGQWGEKE